MNIKNKKINFEININYEYNKLFKILEKFNKNGKLVANHGRNEIKKFFYEKEILNIKQFQKKGYLINLYYNYVVGSKAKRSYEYAKKLLENKIKTPKPIAYFDNFFVKNEKEYRSFYICEHIEYDFTCRDFLWNEKVDKEIEKKLEGKLDKIIEEFTKFTYDLHEKGIYFKDYSPGNVLVKLNENKNYDFYLVDLNRMKFLKNLSFNQRIKNVSKIMEADEYIDKFSKEYSKYYNKKTKEKIYRRLKFYIGVHKFLFFFKDNTRDFRRKIFGKK